jgi:hypothetical protein
MCLGKINEYSFVNNFVSGCVKHTFVKNTNLLKYGFNFPIQPF